MQYIKPFLLTSFLIFGFIETSITWGQNMLPKQGAVCFRIDDDHPYDQMRRLDSLFNAYHAVYTYGLNSQISDRLRDENWWNLIRSMQQRGVEIADHSPNHYTQYFEVTNYADTIRYSGAPGVHHINPSIQNPLANGPRICLPYTILDTSGRGDECAVRVSDNKLISVCNGEFASARFYYQNKVFGQIYLPAFNQVFSWYQADAVNSNDPDTLYLNSYWNEPIHLGNITQTSYRMMHNFSTQIPANALQLAQAHAQHIFAKHGLILPQSWIQPGGMFTYCRSDFMAQHGPEMGYLTAATYPGLYKPIGEFDPHDEGIFSFQWGDFYEENQDSSSICALIANRYARHYISIGTNHLSAYGGNYNFDQLLKNMAAIIRFCQAHKIPIKTYRNASEYIYHGHFQPNYDIFPPLQNDLDGDHLPDAFQSVSTTFLDTGGVAYSQGKMLCATSGTLFDLPLLGGIERGEMILDVSTKGGGPGDEASFFISMADQNAYSIIHAPATSNSFQNNSFPFTIPEVVTRINLNVSAHSISNKPVCISGMKLYANQASIFKHHWTKKTQDLFPIIFLDSITASANGNVYPRKYSIVKSSSFAKIELDTNKHFLNYQMPLFYSGKDSLTLRVQQNNTYADFILYFQSNSPTFCLSDTITIARQKSSTDSAFQWKSGAWITLWANDTLWHGIPTDQSGISCTQFFHANQSQTFSWYPIVQIPKSFSITNPAIDLALNENYTTHFYPIFGSKWNSQNTSGIFVQQQDTNIRIMRIKHPLFSQDTLRFFHYLPGCSIENNLWIFTDKNSSISEHNKPWSALLFPNPAKDEIHLQWPNDCTIEIIDLQGKIWLEKKWQTQSPAIHLQGIPTGVYILRINHQLTYHFIHD